MTGSRPIFITLFPFTSKNAFTISAIVGWNVPKTEATAGESMALPVYPEPAEEHQRYVVELIWEFYR